MDSNVQLICQSTMFLNYHNRYVFLCSLDASRDEHLHKYLLGEIINVVFCRDFTGLLMMGNVLLRLSRHH